MANQQRHVPRIDCSDVWADAQPLNLIESALAAMTLTADVMSRLSESPEAKSLAGQLIARAAESSRRFVSRGPEGSYA